MQMLGSSRDCRAWYSHAVLGRRDASDDDIDDETRDRVSEDTLSLGPMEAKGKSGYPR